MVDMNKKAMVNLSYTIADLRDPVKRAALRAEADRLRAESRGGSGGGILRQRDVAAALDKFDGFERNPLEYGPRAGDVAAVLTATELFGEISPNRVMQLLVKLRASGVIDSAPVMESTGRRGRPAVFWFMADPERFALVLSGALVCAGEPEPEKAAAEPEPEPEPEPEKPRRQRARRS